MFVAISCALFPASQPLPSLRSQVDTVRLQAAIARGKVLISVSHGVCRGHRLETPNSAMLLIE